MESNCFSNCVSESLAGFSLNLNECISLPSLHDWSYVNCAINQSSPASQPTRPNMLNMYVYRQIDAMSSLLIKIYDLQRWLMLRDWILLVVVVVPSIHNSLRRCPSSMNHRRISFYSPDSKDKIIWPKNHTRASGVRRRLSVCFVR